MKKRLRARKKRFADGIQGRKSCPLRETLVPTNIPPTQQKIKVAQLLSERIHPLQPLPDKVETKLDVFPSIHEIQSVIDRVKNMNNSALEEKHNVSRSLAPRVAKHSNKFNYNMI